MRNIYYVLPGHSDTHYALRITHYVLPRTPTFGLSPDPHAMGFTFAYRSGIIGGSHQETIIPAYLCGAFGCAIGNYREAGLRDAPTHEASPRHVRAMRAICGVSVRAGRRHPRRGGPDPGHHARALDPHDRHPKVSYCRPDRHAR